MQFKERITVDYSTDYELLYAEGKESAECADIFTDLFERTMSTVLKDTVREDVGAVIVYTRLGVDIAFFDYENMWGGLYE